MKKNEKNLTPQADQEENNYDSSTVGDAALLELLSSESPEKSSEADTEDKPNNEAKKDKENQKTKEKETSACSKSSDISESSNNSSNSDNPDNSEDQENPSSLAQKLLTLAISLLAGEQPAPEILRLLDAARAAEAIEAARKEGEIAGRNATIEEKLRPSAPSIPTISGSSTSRPRPASIFDLAAQAY